ncbi:MAG: type II toxin-antitoxin system ParD family antitoxin [Thermoplasmatota archaeon]
MNVSVEVTGNLLEYLDQKVKQGFYKSRSEVVRNAIRLMIQKDLEEQLRQKGLDPETFKETRKKSSGELIDRKFKELAKDNS